MIEKALVHLIASQLTQATLAGMTSMPADVKGREALVAQTQVDWYEWIKNTLVDQAWPTPVIDVTLLTNAIKAALVTTPSPANPPPPAIPIGGISPTPTKEMAAQPNFAALSKFSPKNPTGK